MVIKAMIRRRAALDELVSELNRKFVEAFVALPGFWAEGGQASDAVFNPGTGESATLDLRKSLGVGLKGQQIVYAARLAGYLKRDVAQSDDFLLLRLDTETADYKRFCSETLPRLIEIFQPYRAALETDEAVNLSDWKIVCDQSRETGRDIDGRDSVFRIWPVSFFDDLLCRRSFGIGAEEVAARAAPECERAEVLNGGAYLLVSSDLVVGAALNDLNARVMSRLAAP
jgi:hypothetical protein